MSGQLAAPPAGPERTAPPRPARFADALRSEWTKFRSLRSTWFTLLTTVVVGVGLAVLMSSGQAEAYHLGTPEDRQSWDPTSVSLLSSLFAQLAIGVLGVLAATSEYATGMIRTSLAAVPRRSRILAAKASVLTAVALVLGQVVAWGAFAVGQAAIAAQDAPHATLGQPGVFRAVVGAGLYLAAVGLLGLAFGVLLRSTAGALTLVFTTTLLIPLLGGLFPDWFARWWPPAAGQRIMSVVPPGPDALGPWTGFAVMCAGVAATLAAALTVFYRRDA
jgi:ABC-2 type transport system permease protein